MKKKIKSLMLRVSLFKKFNKQRFRNFISIKFIFIVYAADILLAFSTKL